MTSALLLMMVYASSLAAWQMDSLAEGRRALDNGKPQEAAVSFAQALANCLRNGEPAESLLHLRVTLASTYMEAGEYREMEVVLDEAQKTVSPSTSSLTRAELLNAWSALHLKNGQLTRAEQELRDAWRLTAPLVGADDLRAALLHNLAGVEMHTGRYTEAYPHELEALRVWESTLAPDHPRLIRGWASLASLQYMEGQTQDAALTMQRAITSAIRTYGPTHNVVADLLESDAVILDKLKRKKEARRAREQARTIRGPLDRTSADRLTVSAHEVTDGHVYLRTK